MHQHYFYNAFITKTQPSNIFELFLYQKNQDETRGFSVMVVVAAWRVQDAAS